MHNKISFIASKPVIPYYTPNMLSVLATPIGNLQDITVRGIETLKTCDFIICEDTRVTGSLLKKLEIPKKEFVSFHGNSNPAKAITIAERLQTEHGCLVSDAGTPGISDPGFAVVQAAKQQNITIEALPGPAAFLAALSVSGMPMNQFIYYGFLPIKKGRKTILTQLAEEPKTIVLYESVHRIQRTLTELAEYFTKQPEREVCICRELTKLHEQILYTKIADLPAISETITIKGEFVIVIGAKPR